MAARRVHVHVEVISLYLYIQNGSNALSSMPIIYTVYILWEIFTVVKFHDRGIDALLFHKYPVGLNFADVHVHVRSRARMLSLCADFCEFKIRGTTSSANIPKMSPPQKFPAIGI